MIDRLVEKQLFLHNTIGRSLDNYKKIGRKNLTAAKIRSRINMLKETWRQFQNNHDDLMRAVPTASRPAMDYFKEEYFELAEDTYSATMDQMNEDLEALVPVVSHNQSVDGRYARSDASALSLSHLPSIRLPPFDGNYADWEAFRDRFTAYKKQ